MNTKTTFMSLLRRKGFSKSLLTIVLVGPILATMVLMLSGCCCGADDHDRYRRDYRTYEYDRDYDRDYGR